jgi:hypothetical protein
MQEVFFELIPRVVIRSDKTKYRFHVIDPVTNSTNESPAALFIDGVLIDNPALILNLNPERVEKIDILTCDYLVGDLIFTGIINVITKTGDFSDIPLPKNAVRIPFSLFEPARIFNSTDYSTNEKRQKRIPDFRNTLYWNPDIKPDKSGKVSFDFWSSDNASEYLINLQGVTSSGKAVSFKKSVIIK